MALAIIAAGVHLWAGWEDEGRLVLRPVGHITVLAAIVWLFTMGALFLNHANIRVPREY